MTETSTSPLAEMRRRLLGMKAADIGVQPTPALPNVWGVLLETGYPQGTVTLLALADGTTSLYLPTGGGVIGAGEHAPVRAAAEAFLKTTQFALSQLSSGLDSDIALEAGTARLLALTHDGVVGVHSSLQALVQGTGPLSAMYFAGDALLTQVRLASTK